ncbi:MAG TPA: DUF6629 family protein [Rhizomicrobium sp.]
MNVSAIINFAAAALLTVAGLAALFKARHPADIPLALIPLVFGSMQAIEGMIWLAIPLGREHGAAWTNLFIFLTLTVWPLLIPAALSLVEPDPRRRFLMLVLLPASIGVAVDYAGTLLVHPYHAAPVGPLLTYANNRPVSLVLVLLYVICVCTPPLISSNPALRRFGLFLVAGLIVSATAFYDSFISTWSFLAALASLSLLRFFYRKPAAKEVRP